MLAYVFVCLGFMICLLVIQRIDHDRHVQDKIEASERIDGICRAVKVNQDTLHDILLLSGQGGGVDPTSLPSFADLSPETQQWLKDYVQAQSGSGNLSFQQQALARLAEGTLPECAPSG